MAININCRHPYRAYRNPIPYKPFNGGVGTQESCNLCGWVGRWVGASKTFVFVLRKDGGMRKMIAKVGYQILSQNDNFDCGEIVEKEALPKRISANDG